MFNALTFIAAITLGWTCARFVEISPDKIADTLNLLATVFSVLAGFVLLLASMNIEAIQEVMNKSRVSARDKLNSLLLSYSMKFFFVGYISVLSIAVFLMLSSSSALTWDCLGYFVLDLKEVALRVFLFLVPFMLTISFLLPSQLIKLHKNKLTK